MALYRLLNALLSLSLYCIVCINALDGKGLLVIPGLGSPNRLETVKYNLNMLAPYFDGTSHTTELDCVIYVYAPRNQTSFWSNKESLAYLEKRCALIDNPNGKVTANLYLLQPYFIKSRYSFVFILLDDCKLLGDKFFPLDRVMKIMQLNQLTVASPRVGIFTA
jgi:hypothetical protein